jgi:hypothetical protein
MGRDGGLRPSSALGPSTEPKTPAVLEDDNGGWVTITSKFHSVDLAGSQRVSYASSTFVSVDQILVRLYIQLKCIAAARERIEEGISIINGPLTLSNVISTLEDPSRAKLHTA